MKSIIFNIFSSISAKLGLILFLMATMIIGALFTGQRVATTVTERIDGLVLEQLPAISQTNAVVAESQDISQDLMRLLVASSPQAIEDLRTEINSEMDAMGAKLSQLPSDAGAEMQTLLVHANEQINALVAARLKELEAIGELEETVVTHEALNIQISNALVQIADEAFFNLVLGGEGTVGEIDATLEQLIEVDFADLQLALQIRSEANLVSGLLIAISNSSDASLTTILQDLATGASNRMGAYVVEMRERSSLAPHVDAIAQAHQIFIEVLEGSSRTAQLRRSEILSARQSVDVEMATAQDALSFNLIIASEDAKNQNRSSVETLMNDQVAQIRQTSELTVASSTFFALTMEALVAKDDVALGILQERLTSAANHLSQMEAIGEGSLRALLAEMIALAEPETGIVSVQASALMVSQTAQSAAKEATKVMGDLSDRARSVSANAMSLMATDAQMIRTEIGSATERFDQIAILSVFFGCLAVIMAWWTILRPIGRVEAATTRLAAGDLSATQNLNLRFGEIGRIATALGVFRDGLVEKETLAAQTEKERETRTQEQAQVVSSLAEGLRNLSQGQLDTRIEEKFTDGYDNLRTDFNAALEKLDHLMSDIRLTSHSMTMGSSEIEAAISGLSSRTETTAATLETTAANLTQLTESVSSAAERTGEAEAIVANVRDKAEGANTTVQKAMSAMNLIQESSQKIFNIISVMEDIAFQTNLLALNAGVEAARAGPAGKGFAVVASEVRDLSQRSAEAARDINVLIKSSSSQVDEGSQLVSEVGLSLNDIVASVVQINSQVAAIAEVARSQAAALKDVDGSVSELDSTTQQNAAIAEETSAASDELTILAGKLKALLSRFQTAPDASNDVIAFSPHQAAS